MNGMTIDKDKINQNNLEPGEFFANMFDNAIKNELDINAEENIIDVEAADIAGEAISRMIYIESMTPMNIHFTPASSCIVFLCRTNTSELITISRKYLLESVEEIRYIKTLPFNIDESFISMRIANKQITNGLDNYITDMDYAVSDNYNTDEFPDVTFTGINTKTRETVTFSINADLFACVAFIDSYITESIDNEHDLSLASITGSRINSTTTANFFIVEDIEVVSMAPAYTKKKGFINKIKALFCKSNNINIGLVLKLSRTINGNKEDSILLTPFNIGVTFEKEKFRGTTIKYIEENYFGDSDQFVSTLIIDKVRLLGVDKQYMIIRGKTKDDKITLFLLDMYTKESLIKKIEDF